MMVWGNTFAAGQEKEGRVECDQQGVETPYISI